MTGAQGHLTTDHHPQVAQLTDQVLPPTVGRMASPDAEAEQGGVPLHALIEAVAAEVRRRTGTRSPVADATGRRLPSCVRAGPTADL